MSSWARSPASEADLGEAVRIEAAAVQQMGGMACVDEGGFQANVAEDALLRPVGHPQRLSREASFALVAESRGLAPGPVPAAVLQRVSDGNDEFYPPD